MGVIGMWLLEFGGNVWLLMIIGDFILLGLDFFEMFWFVLIVLLMKSWNWILSLWMSMRLSFWGIFSGMSLWCSLRIIIIGYWLMGNILLWSCIYMVSFKILINILMLLWICWFIFFIILVGDSIYCMDWEGWSWILVIVWWCFLFILLIKILVFGIRVWRG